MNTFNIIATVAFAILQFSPILYLIFLVIYSEVKKYSKNSIKYCKIKLFLELIFCIYFSIELVSLYIISIYAEYVNFLARICIAIVGTILCVVAIIILGKRAKSTFSRINKKELFYKTKIIKFPNCIKKR